MTACLDRNEEPIKAHDTVWHGMGEWKVENVIEDNRLGATFAGNCFGTAKI